jgi:hypothetical protein
MISELPVPKFRTRVGLCTCLHRVHLSVTYFGVITAKAVRSYMRYMRYLRQGNNLMWDVLFASFVMMMMIMIIIIIIIITLQ